MKESEPTEELFTDVPWPLFLIEALNGHLKNAASYRERARDAREHGEDLVAADSEKRARNEIKRAREKLKVVPEGDRFIPMLEGAVDDIDNSDTNVLVVDI